MSVIRKSGSTQPRPTQPGSSKNPGQGTGAVPNIGGPNTPIIRKGGATNNGGK